MPDYDTESIRSGRVASLPSSVGQQQNTTITTHTQVSHTGPGIASNKRPIQPGIWNTLHNLARQNVNNRSTGDSDLPSTASPGVPTSHPAPSTHVFGNTHPPRQLFGVEQPRLDNQGSPMSATEVNTPSFKDSPSFLQVSPRPLQRGDKVVTQSTEEVSHRRVQQDSSQANPRPQTSISLIDVDNMAKTCAERLNILENLSYSYVPLEEVEEKFEAYDSRLINLEDFRTDIESRILSLEHNTRSGSKRHRLLTTDVSTSFSSNFSSSESADSPASPVLSATAAVYSEYNGHFEELDEKIEGLSSSFPSLLNPWQVEVVLLPWGRHLPGIWSTSSTGHKGHQEQQRHYRDEWNGSMSACHSIFGESSSNQSGWSTGSIQAWADSASEWLSPRACGPDSLVWRRLWSRGLVQTIEVVSPDAFSFMQRCKSVFDHIIASSSNQEHSISSTRLEYDALREPLIPLRKIRKISRLRFLAPSEMVTSALWNANLLDSSVFMKANGLRRLYLTFPTAYIQRTDDGWTWQTIKNLRPIKRSPPRAGPGFDGFDKSRDFETCWNWNKSLDAPAPCVTSFCSAPDRDSRRDIRGTGFKPINEFHKHPDSASPLISPISDARTLRENKEQTSSTAVADQVEAGQVDAYKTWTGESSKRRSSFKTLGVSSKRRRPSTNSDLTKLGLIITPRLSREPSQPFTSDGHSGYVSDASRPRRTIDTPLAYATPHSHYIQTISTVPLNDRSDETEANTEIGPGYSSPFKADDEWQGMGDEVHPSLSQIEEEEEEEEEEDDGHDRDDDEGTDREVDMQDRAGGRQDTARHDEYNEGSSEDDDM